MQHRCLIQYVRFCCLYIPRLRPFCFLVTPSTHNHDSAISYSMSASYIFLTSLPFIRFLGKIYLKTSQSGASADCGPSLAAALCAVGRVSLRGSEHAIRSGTIAGRNMAGGCQRYMDLPFMDACSESPCHSAVMCTSLCACLGVCTYMRAIEHVPAASSCLMLWKSVRIRLPPFQCALFFGALAEAFYARHIAAV